MRTFHRGNPDEARFWSIDQVGPRLTLRFGKVGSPGRIQTIHHFSTEQAALDFHKRIEQKLCEEYVEQVVVDPLQQALENALTTNPDDLAAHMAYADYLSEKGDPRGEFIQIQLALEDSRQSSGKRQQLKAREQDLLARYRSTWVGSLAWMFPENDPFARLSFARGWIERIRLGKLTVKQARCLVNAPELRLLHHLTILGCEFEVEDVDYRVRTADDSIDIDSDYPALSVLQRAQYFGNVRVLALGDAEGEQQFCTFPDGGNLLVAIQSMPKLRQLDLNSREVDVDNVLQASLLNHLHTLRLERVRLADHGTRLLARQSCSALKRLQIWNARISDDGARALAKSAFIRRLELLDLSFNYLTRTGIKVLEKTGIPVVAEYQMNTYEDHDNEYRDDGWDGPVVYEEFDDDWE
jgi:uncharacterized protein (TIGR02996 family)